MSPQDARTCSVETHRAKESVKDFFEACVPFKLRGFFGSAAKRHSPENYSQVEKLKSSLENPGDVASHNLNCTWYVKESKRLIRSVSFILLRAYPDGNPEAPKQYWQD